jgi:hypothetical protein
MVKDPAERNQKLRDHIERIRTRRVAPDGTYLDRPIVSCRQFILDPEYLNAADRVWPIVLEYICEMNDPKAGYSEAVLSGAIGSAKTTLALYTQAYQLYVLSCYSNPHRPFDLDSTHEIEIIFQSLNRTLAADVDFARFKAMLDESPYFNEVFRYDKGIKTRLLFPKNIQVRPVTGEATGAIGQNVIGGIIDEINFMAQVEKSKKNPDGDLYDQAVENYNAIARRRESRFMKAGGFLPGMLCVVSSARYRGQFTDRKKEDAKQQLKDNGETHIYVYDKRVWEVAPEGRFGGKTFKVYPGTELRKPYIVSEDANIQAGDDKLMMDIPIEFLDSFKSDILNALRDIAGVSTTAVSPYIIEPERVTACFNQHQSIFSRDSVDFKHTRLQIDSAFIHYRKEPRWVHIDLALNRDSCGVVMGCVAGFREIPRGDGVMEMMPIIHIDGILEVRPPSGGEINFEKVRNIVYVAQQQGLKVRWISFDQYQSKDSQQRFSEQGFTTGEISMDRDINPYEALKTALYDGRIFIPAHDKCVGELVGLEIDVTRGRNGKIDHKPNGSKDCSDALAGVVWGLSRRREIWVRYGIPLWRFPKALSKSRGAKEPDGY